MDYAKGLIKESQLMQVDNSLPITSYLAKCRSEKGYTTEDIVNHLRVSRHYIESIENNDFDRFPERVYLIGFVRSYAKFLGIDPEYCVGRFKEEILHEEKTNPLLFPVPLSSESFPGKKALLFSSAALVVLLAAGYGIWRWNSDSQTIREDEIAVDISKNSSASDSASPLAGTVNSTSKTSIPVDENKNKYENEDEDEQDNLDDASSDKTVIDSPSSVPLRPEESGKQNQGAETTSSLKASSSKSEAITLEFSQPSWIEIKDASGKVIIEKTFQSDENYSLFAPTGYVMRTGNAGGVNIKIGESLSRPLGRTGQVLSNLSLDSDALSAYLNTH